MSLTYCKCCGKFIINGKFCNDECETLFDKEEAEACCVGCNRTLQEDEHEVCDSCKFRR